MYTEWFFIVFTSALEKVSIEYANNLITIISVYVQSLKNYTGGHRLRRREY